MTGNEQRLDVYLGCEVIATLFMLDDQLHWRYTPGWQQKGYPVSPHLPLQNNISPLNVQRFLRNLLPEGDGLSELVMHFHLSKSNTFGLVRVLGLDLPGSLMILPCAQALPTKPLFRMIPKNEMQQRLEQRDESGLIIWDGKPRLSMAGVQEKINVVLNEKGALGFGDGSLCSTHMVKFERQQSSHLVLNEYITMQLAKQCGVTVANVSLMRYGEHNTLLVERFDRQFISMKEVKRRHIIDGCQALNMLPEYKYERNFGSARDVAHIRDGASLPKLFKLAEQCTNPALTKQKILDWVLFNLLVFNYDAHGKNISFFVGKNGLALAPFYDLINVKIYPDFCQEMAMGLGDEFSGDVVNAYQLADFADSCQLSRAWLVRRLSHLAEKLILALPHVMQDVAANEDENHYLRQYHELVAERCQHLLAQSNDIIKMTL